MVVMVIIALLAMVAYPGYQQSVKRSRRADAQASLVQLSNVMERLFTANGTYLVGGVAPVLGAGGIFPNQTPIDGNEKAYTLTLTIDNVAGTAYTLTATPIRSQVGDGFLQLNQAGQKFWDTDNSGGLAANENTWNP